MKEIPDRREPQVEKALERARSLNMPWDKFSQGEGGSQLRSAKAREQSGLCGYCECRLSGTDGEFSSTEKHIDHFLPRNKGSNPHPELTYDWDNLILSCAHVDSCGFYKDGGKHAVSPEQMINPRHEDPGKFIVFVLEEDFSANPQVAAVPRCGLSESENQRARDTIKALNLDSIRLRYMRGHRIWEVHGLMNAYVEWLSDDTQSEENLAWVLQEIQKSEQEWKDGEYPSAVMCCARAMYGNVFQQEPDK